MKYSAGTVFAMQVMLLVSCGSGSMPDQQQLRRHFNIGPDTEMLEFSAYPPPETAWQREGLKVQAVFQLAETEMDAIVEKGHQSGWSPLPIPDETLVKLPFTNSVDQVQINIPFDTDGLFLCKTSGNNVLYASENETALCESQMGTLRCSEIMSLEEAKDSDQCERKLSDQILGVLEFDTQKLYVFIGSTY